MGADEVTRTWHFTALLDGKPIGTHDFAVVRQADGVTVDSVAHFKVRVAFITAYVYEHQDHEVWRGGNPPRAQMIDQQSAQPLTCGGRDQKYQPHGHGGLPGR